MLYMDADVNRTTVSNVVVDPYLRAICDEHYIQHGVLSEDARIAVADEVHRLLSSKSAYYQSILQDHEIREEAKIILAEGPSKLKELQYQKKKAEHFSVHVEKQIMMIHKDGHRIKQILHNKGLTENKYDVKEAVLAVLNLPNNKKARSIPLFRNGLSRQEYNEVELFRKQICLFMKNRKVNGHAVVDIIDDNPGNELSYKQNQVKEGILKQITDQDFNKYLTGLDEQTEYLEKKINDSKSRVNRKVEIPEVLKNRFQDFISTVTEDDLNYLDDTHKSVLGEVMEKAGLQFPTAQKRQQALDFMARKEKQRLYHQSPWLAVTESLPPLLPGQSRMFHGSASPVIMNNETALTTNGDDGRGFYTADNGSRSMGYVRPDHNALSAERFEITGGYLHIMTLNFDRASCLNGGSPTIEQKKAIDQVMEKKYTGRATTEIGAEACVNVLREAGIKGNWGRSYGDIIVFKPDDDVKVEETIQVSRPMSPETVVRVELMKAQNGMSVERASELYGANSRRREDTRDPSFVELVCKRKTEAIYQKDISELTPEEFKLIYMNAWDWASHGIALPEQMSQDLEEAANRRSTASFTHDKYVKTEDIQYVSFVTDENGKKWSKRGALAKLDDRGDLPSRDAETLKGRQLHYGREKAVHDIYRLCGVNAPEAFIGRDGCLYREYIENTLVRADQMPLVREQIKKSVAVDVLLDNWDLSSNDNIIMDKEGKVWRVDNGSALDFTGGNVQKDKLYLEDASEALQKLGRAGLHVDAGFTYGAFTDEELASQIRELAPKKERILALTPKDIRASVERRFDNMQKWGDEILGLERCQKVSNTSSFRGPARRQASHAPAC
ncbi:MAG: hypothetical protein PHD48_10015 [Alphaproteobacteria bacterium]|nr:hypothetical protein [Alphaproteobacteria bacterium]